ncbi:hypothetical protein K474DRAFT_243263 [Panus rudis PR-1116 ss-1]|nr:hypothetical protein K474DRAFT_243263 [Panus rudis PR-1116 ss-1]
MPDGEEDLLSLSQVCRRLRDVCKPTLFRRLLCTGSVLDPECYDVFGRIMPYAQTIVFTLRGYPYCFGKAMQPLFPYMTRLRTVIFREYGEGLHIELIKGILTAPNLETFVLEDVVWEQSPPYYSSEAPVLAPLKRFIERQCGIFSPQSAKSDLYQYDPHGFTLWFRCDVLSQASNTMEFIRMPSDGLSLQFLATHSWPSLRELTIYGSCPVVDVPFISVLQAMPSLHTLKCLIREAVCFEICPVELAQLVDIHVPPLQDILVTNVKPADPFFQLLRSDDVVTITIIIYIEWPYDLASTGDEVLRLLRSRTFPALVNLDIGFFASNSSSLQQLCSSLALFCPNVRNLTIHLFHDVGYPSADPIVTALTPLKGLRTLRLDMHFPTVDDSWREVPKLIDSSMQRTIEVLPWLDTISFLPNSGSRKWVVCNLEKADDSIKLGEIEHVTRDRYFGMLDQYEAEG